MNRRYIISLSALTALGLALLPSNAISQEKSLKDQLVGTWIYVSSTGKRDDGSPVQRPSLQQTSFHRCRIPDRGTTTG